MPDPIDNGAPFILCDSVSKIFTEAGVTRVSFCATHCVEEAETVVHLAFPAAELPTIIEILTREMALAQR